MDSQPPPALGSDDHSRARPERSLAIVPEPVLDLYDRKPGWVEEVDPVQFLQHHRYLAHEAAPLEHVWRSRFGALAVLAIILLFAGSFAVHSWRLGGYVRSLFAPPAAPQPVTMGDRPEVLPESEMLPGAREDLRAINENLKHEQWSEAVSKAARVAADPVKLELLKSTPRTLEWLFEVQVAGPMAPPIPSRAAPAEARAAYQAYTALAKDRKPSFRLQYNELLARFAMAGGAQLTPSSLQFNEGLLARLQELEGQFGVELTKVAARAQKIRVVRAFTLYRLLQDVSKKELLDGPKTDPIAVQRWDQLYDLLEGWRRSLGTDRAPTELLELEGWFWGRWYEYSSWFSGEVKLGRHTHAKTFVKQKVEAAKHALNAGSARP
jgi:hypothetical protein